MHNQRRKKSLLAAGLLILLVLVSACSQNLPAGYRKALDAFATGDYEAAAKAFERLGDYSQAASYTAYSKGLVLYEQGAFTEAAPYFEQCQDFMYGKDRYTYCQAYSYQDNGDFTTALSLFESLGAYEDASLWAAYCKARLSESGGDMQRALFAYQNAGDFRDAPDRLYLLETQVYAKALAYKLGEVVVAYNEDGSEITEPHEQSYQKALDYFSMLGDYFDSVDQARECKDLFREQAYQDAEALERDGKYLEAYNAFAALSGYSDAETRAENLMSKAGIEKNDEDE